MSSQIREALRVSSLTGAASDLPVFPLVKSVYASTNTFLSLVIYQHLVLDPSTGIYEEAEQTDRSRFMLNHSTSYCLSLFEKENKKAEGVFGAHLYHQVTSITVFLLNPTMKSTKTKTMLCIMSC